MGELVKITCLLKCEWFYHLDFNMVFDNKANRLQEKDNALNTTGGKGQEFRWTILSIPITSSVKPCLPLFLVVRDHVCFLTTPFFVFHIKESVLYYRGFPCGSAGKESACNVEDLGSIPGLGRSPGEGKGYPLQYSGLENFMDYIVHGVAKSQMRLSDFHFLYYSMTT